MSRSNLRVSSPNYYVTTTENSRIKVWKLDSLSHTKNEVCKLFTELFEPNYLKIHYTSIAIFDDPDHTNCLLALGDSIGRIILFNITASSKLLEISQHTQDASKDFTHVEGGHYSCVNCIKFDKIRRDNEYVVEIISCSNDKKLCRWDLNGELLNSLGVGDDKPACLTVSYPFVSHKKKKSKYLMVAANNINVWNISNVQHQKCIGSFQGHASQTQQLRLSEDNQYLISSGQDRFVYIWKCKSFYKKKQAEKNKVPRAPIYSLGLDDDVQSIDIKTITTKMNENEINYLKQKKKQKHKDKDIATTKSIYLICATSKSTIKIWCFDPIKLQCQTNDNNNNNLKASVEITIAKDNNNSLDVTYSLSWIQHIQFINENKLMILRGTPSMPVIKQIEFIAKDIDIDDDEMSFIGHIVLENVNTSVDVINGCTKIDLSCNVYEDEKNKKIDKHLTVLHVADVVMANPKSYDHYEMDGGIGGNGKRKRQAGIEEDGVHCTEPPAKKQRVDSVTFQDKLYEIERKTEEDKNTMQVKIPNADSLYTLLTQSLKANDEALFDRLLKMQNDDVMREFEGDIIANTLGRISDKMAVDLLEKLTQKFRVSPRQSIPILRWLLPLLNSHSATFAKNLSSRKYLISINQAIDYQIKSLVPAMKLQGRLSLLTNQMDKVHRFREKSQNENNENITAGLKMARRKALFIHDENQINDIDLNINDMRLAEGNNNTNNSNDFIEV